MHYLVSYRVNCPIFHKKTRFAASASIAEYPHNELEMQKTHKKHCYQCSWLWKIPHQMETATKMNVTAPFIALSYISWIHFN